jgi:hypothetical protein
MTNASHYNNLHFTARVDVLESAGITIDDAARQARVTWDCLPLESRVAIEAHGVDDLLEYAANAAEESLNGRR